MGYSRGGRRKTLSCSEHGSPLSTAASSAKQVQPCHGCLPPSLPQTRQWEPRAPQAQKSRDGTRLTQTLACCRCCSLYVPQRERSQQPGCETPGAQPPNCLRLGTFRRKSWSAWRTVMNCGHQRPGLAKPNWCLVPNCVPPIQNPLRVKGQPLLSSTALWRTTVYYNDNCNKYICSNKHKYNENDNSPICGDSQK